MTRTHKSAKTAGTLFERQIADYYPKRSKTTDNRRIKYGIKDRGDITGLRIHGHRLVAECKNTTRLCLPEWTAKPK